MACEKCGNCNCKETNLTEQEKKILKHTDLVQEFYAEQGEPGFSDIDFSAYVKELKLEPNQVKGTLGSLIKKGFITTQNVNSEYNIYYITNAGKAAIK